MAYYGDFAEDSTVYIWWSSNDSNGASITRSTDGSIVIYKNNSAVQKTTANGVTDTEDFDSITGIHLVTIDTSVDTGDIGFWATGSDYTVTLQAATIDGQTVNHVLGTFSIENRWASADLASIASDTAAIESELIVTHSETTAIQAWGLGSVASDTAAIETDTGNIYSDTTIIVSDTIVISSDTAVVEAWGLGSVASDTAAIETDTGNIYSDTTIIVSDTTAIESELILVHSETTLIQTSALYARYSGPRGPGIYLNDAAANTNTSFGTDGTVNNPVSTIAAAKTLADGQSIDRIYFVNDSSVTLAATMTDYEFVGIGEVRGNVVNLGSQDVSASAFYNLAITGVQGGSGRIYAEGCALEDPGAGVTTLHVFAYKCGIVDEIQVDTSNDNIFDSCYSLVAGSSTPIIIATGAAGTIAVRHYSGGIQFNSLSASHSVSLETDGQVIFDASCNVNATVVLRGNMTIVDNTVGMAALTTDAVYDRRSQIITIASDVVLVYSDTTAIHSDTTIINSDTVVISSDTAVIEAWGLGSVSSDTAAIESELILVHSETTVVQSDTTAIETSVGNIYSDTTIIHSDTIVISSDTAAIEAAGGALTVAQASDLAAIESELILVHSETTIVQGWGLSSVASDTAAIESELIVVHSDTTAIHSDTTIIHSDTIVISSDTAVIEGTGGALTVAQASDLAAIESELILVHSETTIIQSDTAVIEASVGGSANFPAGGIYVTITVKDASGTALSGADVWVYNAAKTAVVWRGSTDSNGIAYDVNNALPNLDPSTSYIVVKQKDGYSFVDETITTPAS